MNPRDYYGEYQRDYNYYYSVLDKMELKIQDKKKLDFALDYARRRRDDSHNAFVAADAKCQQYSRRAQEVTEAYEKGKQTRDDWIKEELKLYEQNLRESLKTSNNNPYGNLIEKEKYSSVVESTKQKYQLKCDQYITNREKEIRKDLQRADNLLKEFIKDPLTRTKSSINSEYKERFNQVVESKQKEISDYLDNPNIKKYPKSIEIKNLLSSEKVTPLDGINTRKDLFDVIGTVKTPYDMNLSTKEVDKDILVGRAQNDDTVEKAGMITGVITGIIAFFVFWKVNPVDIFLPHIIHGGLLAGPAGIIRFLIVWAINILLVFVLYVLSATLVTSTPLSLLFYKEDSMVERGVQLYYNYIFSNKLLVLSLVHFWDAAKYAYEEELSSKIDYYNCQLGTIENEAGYRQIEVEERKELDKIEDAAALQQQQFLDDIKKKKESLIKAEKIRIKTLTDNYHTYNMQFKESQKQKSTAQFEKNKYNNEYLELKAKAGTLDNEINRLEDEAQTKRKKLDQCTAQFFDKQFQEESIITMARPDGMNAVKGTLSSMLYLINSKKDRNNLVTLTEIPLKCMPTVMLYNKDSLLTPNLGKELSSFIEWLIDAFLRINPLPLFDNNTINIIDPVTNGLVFYDTKSFPNVKVYSSNSDLADYTCEIAKHIEIITQSCIDLNQPIDICSVNNEKFNRNDEVTYEVNTIQEMREQYCTYNVSIFILPQETKEKNSSLNIINDDLKRYFRNCKEFGILPIFLIDKDTFSLSHTSPTVEAINDIVLKDCVFSIEGVGTGRIKDLSIQQGFLNE